MKKPSLVFLFSYLCFLQFTQAQNVIQGSVLNSKGKPILAANVYLESAPQQGVATDFNGNFGLTVQDLNGTLIISSIGFEQKEISLKGISLDKPIVITLQRQIDNLDDIVVKYTDPISEQFAVIKMDMLEDVYLNPVAQGDPLKGITVLATSTTVDETANVSLRASSASRSRVIFNGVPIINPVRAANQNNQGFFSLLNPEVIKEQNVYPSNPPLTFGNSSAGIVEAETKRNITNNQLQLSAGLVNVGFLLSQKIKKDKSFVQLYSNYQFSDVFVGIQEKSLPNIRQFSTKDAGLNIHTNIEKKMEFNSFSYFIDEQFKGKDIEVFTYTGTLSSNRRRFFTINNLEIYAKNGLWQINSGFSMDNNGFELGNNFNNTSYNNIYTSINYKWFILDNTDIQFGIVNDYHSHRFKDSIPVFYYALSPNSPNEFMDNDISNNILEAYAYTLWNINDRWSFSSAMRSNIPLQDQQYYFSSQMSFKYKPNNKHVFLLSGGQYFSYSVPNVQSKTYHLLQSLQIALDYTYQYKNIQIRSATYYKHDTGGVVANLYPVQKTNTFGLEFSLKYQFGRYFTYTFANSFIHQDVLIYDEWYKGDYHFNYFIKTSMTYRNSRNFTISLTYITRPGQNYNGIIGANYNAFVGFYEPIFDNRLFTQQFNSYNNLSLNLTKYIRLNKHAFVIYASVNNVLNTQNEQNPQYNRDYSLRHFDYFQQRNIYFGMVWSLNYNE